MSGGRSGRGRRASSGLALPLLALLLLAPGGCAHAGAGSSAPAAAAPGGPMPDPGRSPVLLVALKNDDSLAFVDPQALRVLGKVRCGLAPHQVLVAGPLAYVSNYGGSDFTVVDVAARSVVRTIDVSPLTRPHGMVMAGGALWFTAERARTVARLDVVKDKVVWALGTGRRQVHMIAAPPDAKRIYTADVGSGGITVIDPEFAEMTHVETGRGAEGIALTRDGKELWVTNREDSTISVLEVRSLAVTATMRCGAFATRVAFTPDGRRAVIPYAREAAVGIWDVAERRELARVAVGDTPNEVLVTPDGKLAFVSCQRDHQIQVIDLDRQAVTGRLAVGRDPEGLAWAEVMP